MSIVIKNELYNFDQGIGLLKTLYGNDYSNIPKDFKHKDVKAEWDKYQDISSKLYQMSKSEDPEILDLCAKMLESENILFDLETRSIWTKGGYKKVTYKITIFKPKNR